MTPMVKHSGRFAGRFWHLFGFAHHGKAWCRPSNPAFAPSGRFSARFGRLSRCAKLLQNAGHPTTQLSWGSWQLSAFPRTQHGQPALLTEQQLIAGAGHQPAPAFHLLRRAQVRLRPEQVLLEEAIAMLLGEALAIPGAHLLQGHVLGASPQEPALARVAFGITGGFSLHADHTDFALRRLAEMQLLPAGDEH